MPLIIKLKKELSKKSEEDSKMNNKKSSEQIEKVRWATSFKQIINLNKMNNLKTQTYQD